MLIWNIRRCLPGIIWKKDFRGWTVIRRADVFYAILRRSKDEKLAAIFNFSDQIQNDYEVEIEEQNRLRCLFIVTGTVLVVIPQKIWKSAPLKMVC